MEINLYIYPCMETYYSLLNVPENCNLAEIKKAYRTLAKKYHPDLNSAPDAKEKFIVLEEAYSCLSNSHSRLAYDRLLRFKDNPAVRPAVRQKYQHDVERKTKQRRKQAAMRSQMSYEQYLRDELWSYSLWSVILQAVFALLTIAMVTFIFYQISVSWYGPDIDKWKPGEGIYMLGIIYIPVIVGITLLYEPFVKYLVVGKPKKKADN